MRMLKLLVSSLFVSVLFLAAPAHAKKVTMNIGYSVNEGHPYGTFMNLFAERFQTLSGGTVRVKVHCCHKMGSEQEQFKKLQLEMVAVISTGVLQLKIEINFGKPGITIITQSKQKTLIIHF